MSMQRFSGDVVLVTGALSGIGLASARRLHDEGGQVILSDIAHPHDAKATAIVSQFVERARYLHLDVRSEADWQSAVSDVTSHEGLLDVLVHNAGIGLTGYIDTIELDAWRQVQAVNSDGLFIGTKAFASLMAQAGARRRGGASIIVVASILGSVGMASAAAYVSSKGAARLFTKAAAVEFAERQMAIRVNSVHPAFVATALTEESLRKIAVEAGLSSVDIIEEINRRTPMGRMGEPAEIASAIAFLASPDASYITGSELMVDGGYTSR